MNVFNYKQTKTATKQQFLGFETASQIEKKFSPRGVGGSRFTDQTRTSVGHFRNKSVGDIDKEIEKAKKAALSGSYQELTTATKGIFSKTPTNSPRVGRSMKF